MGDYVSYLDAGDIVVVEMANPWDFSEWVEICRDAGVKLVGVGLFNNKINARSWFEAIADAAEIH